MKLLPIFFNHRSIPAVSFRKMFLISHISVVLFISSGFAQTSTNIETEWVEDTLSKMSLDEKIGQMIMVRFSGNFTNIYSGTFYKLKRQIKQNLFGGFIMYGGQIYETAVLTNRMQNAAKIPLLISSDLETGLGMQLSRAVLMPTNMAVGATQSDEMAYTMGSITAQEARAVGINMILAPVADVNNNPGNPIINTRSFGEDPELVAKLVSAFVKGAQEHGVIATVKHFPGHGDTDVDSHLRLPVIPHDRERLAQIELLPFHAAVEAGVGAIMTAHIGVPALDSTFVKAINDDAKSSKTQSSILPATLSKSILTGLLRDNLNFEKLIITDAMTMGGIVKHFGKETSAVKAVKAGADILLLPPEPEKAISAIKKSVEKGEITTQRIDESVRRILEAKKYLGLNNERFASIKKLDEFIGSPKFILESRKIADASVTLLQDQKQIIPIELSKSNSVLHVTIINDFRDSYQAGQWVTEELQNRKIKVEQAQVNPGTTPAEIDLILATARNVDLVLCSFFIRAHAYKGNIGIPESGTRLIEGLKVLTKPIITASFGNPYLVKHCPLSMTYLNLYSFSPASQRSFIRAILGDIKITGRSPVTIPGLYPLNHGIVAKETVEPEN